MNTDIKSRKYWILLLFGIVCLLVGLTALMPAPQESHANPLAPNADETEENNDFSTADVLSIGVRMSGNITPTSDMDYFSISLTPNQMYDFKLTATSDIYKREISIYDSAHHSLPDGSKVTSGATTVVLSLLATADQPYYIRITNATGASPKNGDDYILEVVSPAPTSTPGPTNTPEPPPTNIPLETETNDSLEVSNVITIPGKIVGAITSQYDTDCFVFSTTPGFRYRAILKDFGYTRLLALYDGNGAQQVRSSTATNHEIEQNWDAITSRYYICVSPSTPFSSNGGSVDYMLEILQLQTLITFTPTPTPKPPAVAPTALLPAGFDKYEPNFDFNSAALIAPSSEYIDLNFIPFGQWSNDNDFFRILVKPGLRYTCETSNLDAGVDPNMIAYVAPNFNSAVASNDDIELGNFNSRISYFSTYEGYLYILIGQGDRMKPHDTGNSKYKFRCDMTVPGSSTPAAGYTPAPDKDYPTAQPTRWPTATPQPSVSPIDTPTAPTFTATPEVVSVDLVFRLVTTPEPVVPTPTATGFRTFRARIYFDENLDNQPGAGEGIPGFFIRALSPESGAELARGYTDDQGQVSFTVPTVGMVRVVVPLLGLDRMIAATQPEVIVRIAPPPLPDTIP